MTLSLRLARATAAVLLCAAAISTPAAEPAADQAAIRHVMMAQFDKPDARLQVAPVVVAGDAAVASWAQGDRGGRALLFRKHGQWKLAACAGDALKEVKMLRETGVNAKDAETLAANLVKAEAALPASLRAKFSTFDGFVKMDAAGEHPPAHKH